MNRGSCTLSVIIPTCPPRTAKLRALLSDIATSNPPEAELEVVLVVDAPDDTPLRLADDILPKTLHWVGLTQPQAGPAAARNTALRRARGEWVLFFDDDARLAPDTIPGHVSLIRQDPSARVAHLGRVDLPEGQLNCPWGQLLARSSMVFFHHRMIPGGLHNYRHFCTSNLSVRAELVREAGGFDARFPFALHEDIELGWRLQQRCGVKVRWAPEIQSWHDHPLTPAGYFRREHLCGRVAALLAAINRPCHDETWSWLGDPAATLDVLQRLFGGRGGELAELLRRWSEPSASPPTADAIAAVYQAHVPFKRLAFCQGYLNRPLEPHLA